MAGWHKLEKNLSTNTEDDITGERMRHLKTALFFPLFLIHREDWIQDP